MNRSVSPRDIYRCARIAVVERDPNYLSGSFIDRAAFRRRDSSWLQEILTLPTTRFLAVRDGASLILQGESPEPYFLRASAEDLVGRSTPMFLGLDGEGAVFAVEVGADERPSWPSENASIEFIDFRDIGALLSREHGALLAYARALSEWHSRSRFCSRCGKSTAVDDAGHVRRCVDLDCGVQHFPRTDPAVIMLVTSGNACLLGRQAAWTPGMYSTLAGFVEAGESLEEAVRREVREETGVEVRAVRYHSSQPWPFPSSLMIGFRAEASTTEITLNDAELDDARWMTREEIQCEMTAGSLRLPRVVSISRRLIDEWLAEQGST